MVRAKTNPSTSHASRHDREAALYVGRGRIALHGQKTLVELFAKSCELAPEVAALRFENDSLTYRELATRAKSLAAWMIHDAHIKPGDRIAIYLPNSLSYGVVVYAVWLAQAVVVNLGVSTTQKDVLLHLQDSSAKLLITTPNLLTDIQTLLLQTGVRHIVTTRSNDYSAMPSFFRDWASPKRWLQTLRSKESLLTHIRLRDILSQRSHQVVWPQVSPHDVAVLQYTSGTTGRAKGALLTHGSLIASMRQGQQVMGRTMEQGFNFLCPVTLQHILGISSYLLSVALQGTFTLTSINAMLDNPKILADTPCDVLFGIPLLYDQLLKKSVNFEIPARIKLFIAGGSSVSINLQKQWYARTGYFIIEGYGLSEASPLIAMTPPSRVRAGCAGVITPETEVRVVSSQGTALSFNQAGELWVRGPQLMRGYWQLPQATSEVLTHDGWLRTGDIVSLDEDGYLRVLERKKDVFWVQNELVFPQEIENTAAEHEDVIDCVAVQSSDDEHDHAQRIIKLFVVAKEGLTPEHLTTYLQDHLSSKEIPDRIIFVDTVPRSAMGKVIRRLLHEIPSSVVTKVGSVLGIEEEPHSEPVSHLESIDYPAQADAASPKTVKRLPPERRNKTLRDTPEDTPKDPQ
jgi:long-chain acyl-CoA synthetase